MANRHSSEGFRDGCGGVLASGMTPVAIAPAAQTNFGEGKTMSVATKRAVIATAALAAAGLFGSLPYDGSPVAQQGVPTMHRDVALVDDYTTLLTDEGTFDTALYNDVLGPTGAEATLYSDLSTALGSSSEATTLLDATGATPIFSGDFNGAESRIFEGLFLNGLVSEDQVNQLLGATATESETAILADFTTTGGPPIPSGADVTLADLTGAVSTSSFDTDLTSIANADYTLAGGDLEGYLTSLSGDTSGLSDLSTVLTDFSSSFSDLSNLSTDFSTLLTDLGSLF